MNLLETAAKTPEWLLHPSQIPAHRQAAELLQTFGAGIGNGFVKFVLYKTYAHVLRALLLSNLVVSGRMLGWRPLFLAQNIINQRSGYAANYSQFATVNCNPRSYISLIGFFKQERNNPETLEVIGISDFGRPFTVAN